jgi:acyl transferase domain-containing protein/Zn-dependent alcohol dehydrogenase/acyl carrier protein
MSQSTSSLVGLSSVKLALLARQARVQAAAALRADPIAIIGMACRVPGGGDTLEQYWQILRDGVDTVREVPRDRWDGDRWYDSDLAAAGKMATKQGGFLSQIDGFDAEYFGIVGREAERMDPQQRLFLEVAIEALEAAGLSRDMLRGSRAGAFVASYHNDYTQLQYNDAEAIDARTLTGTLHSVLVNRLSYFLDLRGPSVSVDTACSSSLVAVHLACQSLRSGESDVVLAGGVSLMLTPDLMISMSKVGFMAGDGRCKTFDARADGFGRGEGCGIVVLKRLSDAIADGDNVLAVIRGSAVNQDGHSTLLAAPHGPAQEALIREALANAQLEPERIGFIEAHGTGTALGDPIEVEAIAATLGRRGTTTCWLGSAKANLGHLEAAAGVAGLIKVVLALQHQAIPPQVHFSKLSPHISLDGTRLAIPTALTPWTSGHSPRCAGVSSFGVGGTNAHVIIEEAPALPAAPRGASHAGSRVLILSAQSDAARRAVAAAWVPFLEQTNASLDDLCTTALLRRSHLDWRLAIVGASKEELRARIAEYLRGDVSPFVSEGHRSTTAPRVAFIFSGQGPQWFAMGRELLAQEPAFKQVITACDDQIRTLAGWSLLDVLAESEEQSRLDQTAYAQPALFAIQIGLAALWKSWGIVPDGVVGHSIGELAALHVAGVLSLPDAIRIVVHRGRIMQEATGLGRMASVGLSEAEAIDLIKPYGTRLSVGAINAPRSVVLSGEEDALNAVLATLASRGISHRMLPVQYAFHTAQMAPFGDRLSRAIAGVQPATPALPVYSTVTGALATDLRFDELYFGRNLREPVRLAGAIAAMANDGYDVFVEISPHPVLQANVEECLTTAGKSASVTASLRRGKPERETMLQACAAIHAAGCTPNWNIVQPAAGAFVQLPPYPWQRKRFWIRQRSNDEARPGRDTGHPLLGRQLSVAGDRVRIWQGDSLAARAWLIDHRIYRRLVLPAAAVVETFIAAGSALGSTCVEITGFTMHRPLFVPESEDSAARWQIVATTAAPGQHSLEFFEGDPSGSWRLVASATATEGDRKAATSEAVTARQQMSRASAGDIYQRFAQLGVEFGPAFRALDDVRRGTGLADASIAAPAEASLQPFAAMHPGLLDGAFQLCSVAAGGPASDVPSRVFLPLGVDRITWLRTSTSRLHIAARLRESASEGTLCVDVDVTSPDGDAIARLEGVRFAEAQPGAFDAPDESLYQIAWRRSDVTSAQVQPLARGSWLVFADRAGTADAVVRQLAEAGSRVVRVVAGPSYQRISADQFVVNARQASDFERVLAEAVGPSSPLQGVLHFWSLDLAPFERGSASEAQQAEQADLLACGSALHLIQGLVGASRVSGPVWLVSRGAHVVSGTERGEGLRPAAAGLWGLSNVAAVEHPELPVRTIDLDPDATAGDVDLLIRTLRDSRAARVTAVRDGQPWQPRLAPMRAPQASSDEGPRQMRVVHQGTLDGIALRPVSSTPLGARDVRVRVLAVGVNFRDVLVTLDLYSGEPPPLGAECAGVVTEVGTDVRGFRVGDRVFGLAFGSMGTEVVAPEAFLAAVPTGMTLEAAAGLPVAFLTAHYGLHRLARLQPGERVLIHAAAGGVGMAALQIALRAGAEVFATAGSPAKREWLRAHGVTHVMDSRSLSFESEIATLTDSAGVNVVVNSLAGDFIAASLRTLGRGGRFLELGKRDILTREQATALRPDVQYDAYDLGSEAQANPAIVRPMLDEIVAAMSANELTPLPITVFALDDAKNAFRFMAQARHLGKIVLRTAASRGHLRVDPLASYWVTGGFGALGIETARWLARQGARCLVLSGRRPPTPNVRARIAELEQQGVTVHCVQADIADQKQTQQVLDEIRAKFPPLRGVVHAAGTLRDAVLINQRWDDCREVMAGKAHGARVLHTLTRHLPLDFFILYSAAGAVLGAAGQGVYPAANMELNALAQARRAQGLPALSVAWGAWGGEGMASSSDAAGVWEARGLRHITPESGFARLEQLLRAEVSTGIVLPIDWSRFLARLPEGLGREFFQALAPADVDRAAPSHVARQGPTIEEQLGRAPAGQRRQLMIAHVRERALHVLGLEPTTVVSERAPLKDAGLDSLMAVELRNTLVRSMGKALPATLLFDYPTLETLAGYLLRTSGLEQTASRQPVEAPVAVDASGIAALSDEEAEAQLIAELERSARGSTHG